MNTRVTVVIPSMNERETIKQVVEGCAKALRDTELEIIVVDRSTDNTSDLATEAGAKVVSQHGEGVGNALRQGFEMAAGELIVFLDGDATYLPEDIPRLLDPLVSNEADLVNGNRFADLEQGAMTRLNRIGNRLITSLTNRLFGTRIVDSQSGMKAVTRYLLESIVLRQAGFSICSEMIVEAARLDLRILEVPISYRKRLGRTKLNPLREGFKILSATIAFLKDYNPLLLYGGVGTLLILVGLIVSVPVVMEYIEHGTFTLVGRALFAVLSWVLGLLLIVIGLTVDAFNYSIRKVEEMIIRSNHSRRHQ